MEKETQTRGVAGNALGVTGVTPGWYEVARSPLS